MLCVAVVVGDGVGGVAGLVVVAVVALSIFYRLSLLCSLLWGGGCIFWATLPGTFITESAAAVTVPAV